MGIKIQRVFDAGCEYRLITVVHVYYPCVTMLLVTLTSCSLPRLEDGVIEYS